MNRGILWAFVLAYRPEARSRMDKKWQKQKRQRRERIDYAKSGVYNVANVHLSMDRGIENGRIEA